MPEIQGIQVPFIPAGGISELRRKNILEIAPQKDGNFNKLLTEELTKIKFSAHAQSRLTSRELVLTAEDIIKLESSIEKARQKGANESLILINDNAFIVSVKNQTVVTVFNKQQMENNVITNIDSAVLT